MFREPSRQLMPDTASIYPNDVAHNPAFDIFFNLQISLHAS